MSPSRIFILRPVATTLLMVAILLVGIVGYRFLPVSALPEVDYPTIQVSTFYPGASPEVMTTAVTAPLERQFGEMPGLNQMSSISSAGASVTTLQFGLDITLDVAEQEVQAAINAATNLLPSGLPAPPVYAKVNPADTPVISFAVTSKTLPLTQVEDIADVRIAQKLSQVSGVGLVSIAGGQRPALRVQINPRALAAYGLAIDDIRTDITNENTDLPKGNFDGPSQDTIINNNDQLQTAEDYRQIIVAYKNGGPVRLSDVATVVEGPENNELAGWANRTPAIILNVQRQPGSNVIAVVDAVKATLPRLEKTLPAGLDVTILSDQTGTIRASVNDVEFELGLAVVLVVLVIFVFLRDLRATLIPSLSAPLSIVGTFAGMYLFGFSLDNLSLMSLTIATGFVVDDAIVMIENIARYLEMGKSPLQAALQGSDEIGFTIVSLTVSLIAVLIPLLFMGDVVGRLFHEFAVTLAMTIVLSAVVSLTLVPMMCALILRHRPESARNRLDLAAERGFDWIIRQYDRGLTWVLDHQDPDPVRRVADARRDRRTVHGNPQGIFPRAGHRRDSGNHHRCAGHLVSGDGRATAGPGGRDSRRSRRRGALLVHRRRRDQHDAQQRPHADHLEAARRPRRKRQPDHSPHRGGNPERPGHFDRHAAGAGSDDRQHRRARAISVLSRKSGSIAICGLGSAPRPADAGDADLPGRLDRHGAARPSADDDDRPSDRGAFRHYAGDGGQRALRRVRPAHRFDLLHAVQPVPHHPECGPARRAGSAGSPAGNLSALVHGDHGTDAAVGRS